MEYCGIDLHAEYSQICILDEGGEVMGPMGARYGYLTNSSRRGTTYHIVALAESPAQDGGPQT
jgi:hypothetical protein